MRPEGAHESALMTLDFDDGLVTRDLFERPYQGAISRRLQPRESLRSSLGWFVWPVGPVYRDIVTTGGYFRSPISRKLRSFPHNRFNLVPLSFTPNDL
jgi:hypothetical protein